MKKREITGKFGLSKGSILAIASALLIVLSSLFFVTQQKTDTAYAATTDTLNFQGRLMSSSGNIVDDGVYNMQFSIYYVSSGGTAQWTEDRLVTNSQGVTIKNGYFSVNLGEYDAFGPINWGNDLYLGMTVRGTTNCAWGSCSPADSEMTPRLKLTSVPYAFKAGNVGSNDTNSASTNSNNVNINTGNALGASSNSGNIGIDVGTATGTAGTISIGTANTSGISIGRTGVTTTNVGALTVTQAFTANGGATIVGATTINTTGTANTQIGNATGTFQLDSNTVDISSGGAISGITGFTQASGNFVQSGTGTFSTGTGAVSLNGATTINGSQLTNTGATLNSAMAISDLPAGGNIGTAATTVDIKTTFNVNQTTAGQTLTLPSPTDTTSGRIVYINNVGSASFTMYGSVIATGKSNAFIWNGSSWVTTVSLSGSVVNTVGTIDAQPKSSDGAVISSNAIYLQTADATYSGLVSTGTQTFAGVKTFNDNIILAAAKTLTITGSSTASRPASPTEGMVYFDTTTKKLLVYSNGKWQADRVTSTKIVAASNSSQEIKDAADYVADGAADEVEINNALTAAAGGKVYLAEGTYVAAATILIPNNTTLEGAGRSTKIEFADLDNTDNLIENSDTSTGTSINIRNLKLDGRKDLNTTGTQTGIYMNNLGSGSGASARQGGIIENLWVENFNSTGIRASASSNLLINNNSVFNNSASGIYIEGGTINTAISNNNVQGSGYYGIRVVGDYNSVTNNTIRSADVAGIFVDSSSDYTVVSSNNVISTGGNGTSNGIMVTGADYTNISSNIITDTTCTTSCYAINISNASADNTFIGNNTIVGPSADYPATINNSGTGTIFATQATTADKILQSSSSRFVANTTNVITGSIDPIASTSVTGVGTYFTSEIQVGDRITVSGETRTVVAVGSNTSLTVDNAFTDTANDTSVDRLPAALVVTNSSGVAKVTIDDTGALNAWSGSLTVGTASQAGSLSIFDGSNNYGTFSASGLTSNQTYSLPDASGTLALITSGSAVSGVSAFVQGGNTWATTAVLGTNDAFDLNLETNNTVRLNIGSTGSSTFTGGTTGVALTVNNSTSTGNIIDFQDNGATQLSVLDGGDLQFTSGSNRKISVANQTVSNTQGNSITLQAADGNGSGWGGGIEVLGGNGGITGSGGWTYLVGGAGGATSGNGGGAQVIGGNSTSGNGGGVWMVAGSSTSGNGGNVTIISGTSSGSNTGGYTSITAGTGGTTGAGGLLTLQGGAGGTTSGNGGGVSIQGGTTTSGTGGSVSVSAGNSTGANQAGANTLINGGASTGNANGGNILLQVVSAGNTGSSLNGLSTIATLSGSSTWQNAGNNLPAQRADSAAVSVNGYMYVIGGVDNSTSTADAASNVVYYAKVNSNGTVGSWSTTSALPAARAGHTATYINGYIYVVGGSTIRYNGTVYEYSLAPAYSNVYYAKVNKDGTLGAWNSTGAASIPVARVYHSAETYNGYLYIIGGSNDGHGTGVNTVYYAKPNADGSINSNGWNTTSTLATGRLMHESTILNGKIYVVWGTVDYGKNPGYSVYDYDEIQYASMNTDGTIGSFSSVDVTSADGGGLGKIGMNVEAVNGKLMIYGGSDWGGAATVASAMVNSRLVYSVPLTSAGVPVAGAATTVGYLNTATSFGSSTVYNGSVYRFGGSQYNTQWNYNYGGCVPFAWAACGNTSESLVEYHKSELVRVNGGLDLLAGFDAQTSLGTNSGGAGILRAGDTSIVGKLEVAGQTLIGESLTVQGGVVARGNSFFEGAVGFGTQTSVQSCATNCTITQANIDNYSSVLINAASSSLVISMPDPQSITAGKMVYVTAVDNSNDFILRLNSGGTQIDISMKENTTATLVWNGSDWTAAGASSSTDLQAAYNNTLTSAGGAELVLAASGGSADGLTIRNNATTPITGALLEVQTSIGSNLLSVNNNATEYAQNGGAETSTFTMWTAAPAGGTISRYTTAGNYIATGQASTSVVTGAVAAHGVRNTLSTTLTANLKYSVSFAVRGTTNFSTLEVVYSRDGTNTSTTSCASAQTVTTGKWSRIICTFTAPSSGITASNAIFIRQTDAIARTYYVDNLSVNVSADVNHAVDGSVDSALGTNWTNFGTLDSLTRDTTTIYDTSGSVNVNTPNATDRGVRNNMSITPSTNTQYLVTFYAKSSNTFNDIRVRYSRDGGTNFVSCTDYNTQNISTTTWTEVTCLFTTDGTTATNPDLIIDQPTGSDRNFYIDALSITLNQNTANNVQVGGANKGGPTTLFTLDRGASPPVGENNDAYLGSMYYDTVTGRIQCYEADGWGACGAAPDNIVNLNPEYAGAVLNGTGVGTMTADFCSNDSALSVNSTLCSTGQAKNYYRWTSPQATQQTYSIYVTYQLPATFRGFSSDDTVQLIGRVDNTSNASVTYEMFKSTGSAVTQCGSGETNVITGGGGSANTWYSYGINGNEATGCSFNSGSASNFVIFKINLKANSNANAYISTLSFTTTGQ
ncbi:MAG: hypothetical protein U0451_02610 [Candidatus Saccharimonadales bacterium]